MIRLQPLPQIALTNLQPAFYDVESVTAIEMVSKFYSYLQNLVDDYNVTFPLTLACDIVNKDGKIEWDDDKAGFWTGSIFYEWPDAEWRNGQLVLTNFPGLDKSRMTFRIQTKEIQNVSAAGSVGVGFYVENNTSRVQSIGFYMVGGDKCCLKNEAGSKILFISKNTDEITEFRATDKDMAMIPAGEKGWVLSFYDQFTNLWSSAPYDPATNPIRMPGFELTNLIIDQSKGETVIIDNVFFFGEKNIFEYLHFIFCCTTSRKTKGCASCYCC